jgi:hypothetical protein
MCVGETTIAPGDDTQAHDVVFNPDTNEFVAVAINQIQQTVQNKRQTVQTIYTVVGYQYDSNGIRTGNPPFFLVAVIDGKYPKNHIQVLFNLLNFFSSASTPKVTYFWLCLNLTMKPALKFGALLLMLELLLKFLLSLTLLQDLTIGTFENSNNLRFPQITYNPITSAFLISWEYRNTVDLDTDAFVARVSDDGVLLSAISWGSLFDDRAPDVAFNPMYILQTQTDL